LTRYTLAWKRNRRIEAWTRDAANGQQEESHQNFKHARQLSYRQWEK